MGFTVYFKKTNVLFHSATYKKFTRNGVNTTAVGTLTQRDRTTMRKEIDVNGVNISRIPGRARQAFSFLKTQSCQLHAVKNGKNSTSWNVRRCHLRKQHKLLLK
jgi:hypothetical protein